MAKAISELNDKHFACKPDADIALADFIKEQKGGFFKITGSTRLVEIPEKRAKAGRPPKCEPRNYHSCYQVSATLTFDQKQYEQARERLSCFVLIRNHQHLGALKILNEYRNQTVVKNRFKFIKDPIMVLQIRVRKALEHEIEPITLAGKKKSFEPTASKILELFALLR